MQASCVTAWSHPKARYTPATKPATTWIRQLIAVDIVANLVDFVADAVDFVASVYRA